MKAKGSHILALALLGIEWAAVAGPASAESMQTEMRKVCAEVGGRFEQSWHYEGQGTPWSEVLSCSTSAGAVICQNEVCQITQKTSPNSVKAAGSWADSNDNDKQFSINAADLAGAVAALAEK